MTIQITILGLNKLGASAGLALGRHAKQVERIGYDDQNSTAFQARKINAVDSIETDLSESIKKADIIFLAQPLHKVHETLNTICSHVRDGVVILDTSPAKEIVTSWVKELFPAGCHYVGISPMLHPRYLLDQRESIDAANADLFENRPLAIAAPVGTPPSAINLAADLSNLLGARPFFCDLAEMDGLIAVTRLLPQLVSTALLNATLDQPGWRDARMFAGVEYAAASSGIAGNEESASLRESAILNKSNLLRCMDGFLAALQGLRTDIETGQVVELESRLEHARLGRAQWWHEIHDQELQGNETVSTEMPRAGDYWKQQLGFFSRGSDSQSAKKAKKD